MYTHSRYVNATKAFAVAGGTPGRVLFSTRSGESLHVSEGVWRALSRDAGQELPLQVVDHLLRARVLVPAGEDELGSVLAENAEAIAAATELEQVIQPSAACQLGCSYCGQVHRPAHMTERIQDLLLARIDRRLTSAAARGRPFNGLNIGWFGGEPLLGLAAMRRLTPKLRALAEQHACAYAARVVTNGLRLKPDVARELADVHAVTHVDVTIDGPARFHDARRATKDGQPSFHTILTNLLALAEKPPGFPLALRCNVDRNNAEAVPELIELLAGYGLHRFAQLYFSPVYAWGNDADAEAVDPDTYASQETEWLAQMMTAGFTVDLLPQRRRIVCLAVQPGARVTDAFGNEYNCTEVPYVPAYGSPNSYATGHVDGRQAAAPFFREFNDNVASGKQAPCHACPVLPVCGGACPKAWSEGKPPCPSYKRNLTDRLLLSYAQRRIAKGTAGVQ
jgi:uncharacterized protein